MNKHRKEHRAQLKTSNTSSPRSKVRPLLLMMVMTVVFLLWSSEYYSDGGGILAHRYRYYASLSSLMTSVLENYEFPSPRNDQTPETMDSASPGQDLSLTSSSTKNTPNRTLNQSQQIPESDAGFKKILLLNTDSNWYIRNTAEPFAGCAVKTCLVTRDRNRFPYQHLDAVVWHYFHRRRVPLPQYRSPKTVYIMFGGESPINTDRKLIKRYSGVFNWTCHYRHDSDIVNLYGKVVRKNPKEKEEEEEVVDIKRLVENKTKLVAWFRSNLRGKRSNREKLVQTLQSYIPVDIYGHYGPFYCPKSSPDCNRMLQRDYKFYLAFENSFCRDYITEKFFRTLKYYVVPVVWGMGNYERDGPPHSYIDASAFISVRHLADYLLYLHHNDTAYMEYFKWKETMKVLDGLNDYQCEICKRLHDRDHYTKTQVYDNLFGWFFYKASCRTEKDEEILNYVNGNNRTDGTSLFATQ